MRVCGVGCGVKSRVKGSGCRVRNLARPVTEPVPRQVQSRECPEHAQKRKTEREGETERERERERERETSGAATAREPRD